MCTYVKHTETNGIEAADRISTQSSSASATFRASASARRNTQEQTRPVAIAKLSSITQHGGRTQSGGKAGDCSSSQLLCCCSAGQIIAGTVAPPLRVWLRSTGRGCCCCCGGGGGGGGGGCSCRISSLTREAVSRIALICRLSLESRGVVRDISFSSASVCALCDDFMWSVAASAPLKCCYISSSAVRRPTACMQWNVWRRSSKLRKLL